MMNLSTLIPYPLYTDIEDCYVPDWAGALQRALYRIDYDSLHVTITLYAEEAASELGKQVN